MPLTEEDLDACAALVDELVAFALDRIVAARPTAEQIATKASDADWVTETDLAVERHVRSIVEARFPEHRVVGEEFGESGDADARATWWIDPVDGTTNFVHGLPWSSFSVAVVDEQGAAVGAVADPYRREVLSAVRGRGARRDGEAMRAAESDRLVGGIFLTELMGQGLWPGQAALMTALAERGCVTRIMGSNALTLASVGAGRVTASFVGRFNPIDCHAGALIAAEAGARVVEIGEGILCAAPAVADELLALWQATAGN